MAKSRTSARSSRWLSLLAIVLLIGCAAAWAFGDSIKGNAETGTAYMARVACSCRYVAGRSLDDCRKDRLDGMELITLADNDENKSVTARFPLLADNTARYREGYGCVLEPWEN